jgi:lipopolysaccharide transport protein LptA
MANSRPEGLSRTQRLLRVGAAGLAAISLLGGASSPALSSKMANCKISMESGPADLDARTHLINMHDGVKISQCDISISADNAQATGLDFNNSRWIFTGKVHVRSESQGDLQSDQATVEFSNNVLARAIVTGSPAQFVQTASPAGGLIRGHATTIDYEVLAGTVTLAGDAWLTRNDNKMDAPSITYDVRKGQIVGEVGTTQGGRVHMTIMPKSEPGSATSSAPGKP